MFPEVFGKYVLLERLDAGGTGEVLLAKADSAGRERYFAIRRIPAQSMDNDEKVAALMSEAKLMISFVHPNIAQVFEFGKVGEHFFLAMEYVEGTSLARILSAVALGAAVLRPADAIAIILQVCRALDYAHDRRDATGAELGVVHRDLRPENVLVDKSGLVKLIDFGLVRATANPSWADGEPITEKIRYKSPEQAAGSSIDRRSDIYSVGSLLYEALALKRMVAGRTPSIDTILYGQAPEALRRVLRRALAANPDDRFATAGEMERDLSQAQRQLDPAYAESSLARLVHDVDTDREARVERFRSYSKINPAVRSSPINSSIGNAAPAKGKKLRGVAIAALTLLLGGGAVSAWYFAQQPVATPVGMHTLRMDSVPNAAKVFIDGELTGLTPGTFSGIPGDIPHVIRVEKQGYAAEERTLEPGGPLTVFVHVELKALVGESCVSVTVDPWAYVSVDGSRVGVTPQLCIRLAAGRYKINLSNPELGINKDVDVTVKAGETSAVNEHF